MTTEFNILDYPYPLPERPAVPTLREQFEAQALVLAVKHYGYKEGDALLKSILERRANDRYMVDWVEGAWIGYQAGRESVVVDLPPELRLEAGVFAYDATDTRIAIEAAGGTVKA